jgi:beta-lactamase regulating signal transducer with metallopeptidase domain
MSPLFESIALWLADVHLLAGALLAVVLPGVMLLRQPAQRMAVAKSTLAALAPLVILCSLPGWSLVHLLSAEARPAPAMASVDPTQPTPQPQSVNQLIPHLNIEQVPAPTAPPAIATATPLALEPAVPSDYWPTALVVVQTAGSLVVVAWLAAGAFAARRLRRNAEPAPAELAALLADLAGSADHPALLVSSAISTPVALGVRRPVIMLPLALASSGGTPKSSQGVADVESGSANHHALRQTLGVPPGGSTVQSPAPRAILAHELAHIAAGDLRTLAVARLLLVLFWPQPLFWLLRRRVRFDQESLADAAAVEVAGRVDYAEQLLGWAREAGPRGRAPRLAGAVGLWEGRSQLKRRIALLLDEQVAILRHASRRWRVGTACAALVAAALLSLVTLQRQEVVAADAPSAVATSQERATITGRIVFEDGSPVTKKGWLYSVHNSVDGMRGTVKTEGHVTDAFTVAADPGTITLKHFPDGYAPAWVGPLDIEGGEEYDLVITLRPGSAADVEIVAEDGSAIPNVQFHASPVINGSTSGNPNRPINVTGRFKLEHLASVPYQVYARAAGYQPLRGQDVNFQADRPLRLTMRKSQEVRGTIRDAKGAPAAKARVLAQAELDSRGVNQTSFTSADKPTAVAGEDGRFSLDELADDVQYACMIETADKARLFVPDLCAGDPDKDYVVAARRDLRGRILGDLSGLAKREGKPYVRVYQRIEGKPRPGIGRMGFSGMVGGEVTVTPTADGGEFTYEGLLEGEVEITAGDDTQAFDVAPEGDTEVVFELQAPAPPATPAENEGSDAGRILDGGNAPPSVLLTKASGPALTVRCLDFEGVPLQGVWLETYQFLHADSAGTFAKRGASKTGSRGDYVFATDRVIAPISGMRSSDGNYSSAESTVLVIAHAKGLATAIRGFDAFDLQRKGAEVKVVMEPAVTLKGVVLDPDGRPAPGAIVRRHSVNGWPVSLDNVHNAITDDDGRFVVDDLAPFAGKLTPDEQYIKQFVSGYVDDVDFHATLPFIVTHPEFAAPHLFVERVPDNLRITLEHPGEVSGRIVYGSSDSTPATEVVVRLAMPREDSSVDPTAQTRFYEAETRTDADGRFRLRRLPSGEYVARAHYDGFGLTVPERVRVTSNSLTAIPLIMLPVVNSIARFQLRDASGAPLLVARGTTAHIIAFTPDSPRSSVSAVRWLPISSAGTCSMRLPAGRYRFIVNVDLGKVDGQSQWLHTNDVAAEIVEGESSEVDVIFADAHAPASPSGDPIPADNQGAGTGGVLDTLDPTRGGDAPDGQGVLSFGVFPSPQDGGVWRLVPAKWGYGVDDANEAPLRR